MDIAIEHQRPSATHKLFPLRIELGLEESPGPGKVRVGRGGFVVIALVAIITTSGLFYIYETSPSKVSTQPTKTSLRYDEVLLDDFELGGVPNINVWNVTGSWGPSTGPRYPSQFDGCFRGSYCVWSGTVHSQESQMILNLSSSQAWVNYTSLYLNFSLWVDTNANDVLYVDYFNSGNWNIGVQYSGHSSTTEPLNRTLDGWFVTHLTVPTATTMMRFRYSTGCCETLYRGVFIDEVGAYMVGPGSFGSILVSGRDQESAPLSFAVSLDGGSLFKTLAGTGFNSGVTFLSSSGNHTLSVPSTFTDGSKSYLFASWSDGSNSISRLVNVPKAGRVQLVATFRLKT